MATAIAISSALGAWAIAYGGRVVPETDSRVVPFTIPPPENTTYQVGKISYPDGRWLAFIGVGDTGKQQLWVRKLDSLTAQALAPATYFP